MPHASGTFTVNMTPEPANPADPADAPGALRLDKQFQGDLQGTSQGRMLTTITPVQGSAGYVAMERVHATLHGRAGTFALQHSGIMDRGSPQLTITVVPDSGTDELAGIAGTMNIDNTGGQHSYTLVYTLQGET